MQRREIFSADEAKNATGPLSSLPDGAKRTPGVFCDLFSPVRAIPREFASVNIWRIRDTVLLARVVSCDFIRLMSGYITRLDDQAYLT
jgi:hypothetical protein